MKKILLLDDNVDIVQVVEAALTYAHFEVHATTKCAEFLAIASRYEPDLIILDYRLEDGNGGELCRAVKAHRSLKNTPVIIFTAYLDPRVNLFAFGCDTVIAKPFDLDELLGSAQRLTGLPIDTDAETV